MVLVLASLGQVGVCLCCPWSSYGNQVVRFWWWHLLGWRWCSDAQAATKMRGRSTLSPSPPRLCQNARYVRQYFFTFLFYEGQRPPPDAHRSSSKGLVSVGYFDQRPLPRSFAWSWLTPIDQPTPMWLKNSFAALLLMMVDTPIAPYFPRFYGSLHTTLLLRHPP